METCGTCKFGRAFEEPGPEPAPLETKSGWFSSSYPAFDWKRVHWMNRQFKHERMVRCCLNPTELEKPKDSFCQFWTPQTT